MPAWTNHRTATTGFAVTVLKARQSRIRQSTRYQSSLTARLSFVPVATNLHNAGHQVTFSAVPPRPFRRPLSAKGRPVGLLFGASSRGSL